MLEEYFLVFVKVWFTITNHTRHFYTLPLKTWLCTVRAERILSRWGSEKIFNLGEDLNQFFPNIIIVFSKIPTFRWGSILRFSPVPPSLQMLNMLCINQAPRRIYFLTNFKVPISWFYDHIEFLMQFKSIDFSENYRFKK